MMANWCSNTVWFEGEADNISQVQQLFERMAAKEKETEEGQLPDFIQAQRDWFFNIQWLDDALYYNTKWSPNTDVLREIAERYQLEFTQDYEELGCLIFGKAEYKNGILHDTCLQGEDFDSYEENEDDTWLFEGETYSSDYEILEILLERKIKN